LKERGSREYRMRSVDIEIECIIFYLPAFIKNSLGALTFNNRPFLQRDFFNISRLRKFDGPGRDWLLYDFANVLLAGSSLCVSAASRYVYARHF
jgi:hypothetical protein